MTILIRKLDVLKHIEQRYGNVDNFVREWEEQIGSGTIKAGSAKDRATIYRWLNKGLPNKTKDVFSFCGALDLDPISILDFEGGKIIKNFGKIRRSFQLGAAGVSSFRPLWEMFYPGPSWPSNELAESYYGRTWTAEEFEHEASDISNKYALLNMQISNEVEVSHPVVFHIAYRRKSALDKMWRPYGSIIRINNVTKLISESGDFQEIRDNGDSRRVRAETFYGPSPVKFKLASLHKFKLLEREVPSTATGVVRFHG